MYVVIDTDNGIAPTNSTPAFCQYRAHVHVLSALGMGSDAPPVGDLFRQEQGLEGRWLIASPISWQATHNDGMIVACGRDLSWSDALAKAWFSAFQEFAQWYGITAYYHDPYTWLICCDDAPHIFAKSPDLLRHHSLMDALKQLDDALFWLKFITESQLFFSAHTLNQTHSQAYVMNGVWVWGDGVMPSASSRPLFCQNEHLLSQSRRLSTAACLYQPSLRLEKNSVLWFDAIDEAFLLALEKKLQAHTVHWYWNNVAYVTHPISWLKRFMRNS